MFLPSHHRPKVLLPARKQALAKDVPHVVHIQEVLLPLPFDASYHVQASHEPNRQQSVIGLHVPKNHTPFFLPTGALSDRVEKSPRPFFPTQNTIQWNRVKVCADDYSYVIAIKQGEARRIREESDRQRTRISWYVKRSRYISVIKASNDQAETLYRARSRSRIWYSSATEVLPRLQPIAYLHQTNVNVKTEATKSLA